MEPIRSQEGMGQFSEAFAIVKRAKNVFWWVLLLCLLVQLAGFVMVRFTNYVSPRLGQSAQTPATHVQVKADNVVLAAESSTQPATTAPAIKCETLATQQPSVQERPWYHVFCWLMPTSMFLGVIVGLLLILTLMWTVKLALLARASGMEGYMSGFFWSLIFWVLVIPWQHVMRGQIFVGATFSLQDLLNGTTDLLAGDGGRWADLFYYARFAAYPAIAVIVLLIVQSKFAAGYKRMTYSAETDITTPQTPTAPKL